LALILKPERGFDFVTYKVYPQPTGGRVGNFLPCPGRNRFLPELLPKHVKCSNRNIINSLTFYRRDSKGTSIVKYSTTINTGIN